jgi:hydrogenase maturation protease
MLKGIFSLLRKIPCSFIRGRFNRVVHKGKRRRHIRTFVIGLGNTILSDDGVGIYVVRELGNRINNPNVTVKEASLGGLELLDLMTGSDLVYLIDAVITGKHEVGTLIEMRIEDTSGGSAMARHQISLSEALMLGRRLKMDLPEEIIIYGIEVEDNMTLCESCTPSVAKRIPEIADEILHREFV